MPEGEKLAAKYLKGEANLVVELSHHDKDVRKYVVEGASEILVRNLNLPRDGRMEKTNKRVMEGLKNIKTDKVKVENIYSGLRRIFSHYAERGQQQKMQAYESLKAQFEAKLQQAVQQQYGTMAGIRIDVVSQPQFQEEWRKLQARMDSQYLKFLDEYKHELLSIQ